MTITILDRFLKDHHRKPVRIRTLGAVLSDDVEIWDVDEDFILVRPVGWKRGWKRHPDYGSTRIPSDESHPPTVIRKIHIVAISGVEDA